MTKPSDRASPWSSSVPALRTAAARLGAIAGAEHVSLDEIAERLVLRPAGPSEIAEAMREAREHGLALLPGQDSPRIPGPRIVLDPARLSAVLAVDETSLLVHAQAGLTAVALEALLETRGLHLGVLLPRSRARTIGALLAAPRPSEATPAGTFLESCAAIEGVLPDGVIIGSRLAPRRAAGPDTAWTFLGARGVTGVITAAWLRVLRRGPASSWLGWAFAADRAADALSLALELLDRGARPVELLLCDVGLLDDDAPARPLRAALQAGEVLVAMKLEGARDLVAGEESLATRLASDRGGRGGRSLPPPLVESWLRPREGAARVIDALAGEVFVPRTQLERSVRERSVPSLLCGFHARGAALLSSSCALAAPPELSPVQEALRRRLDPAGILAPR